MTKMSSYYLSRAEEIRTYILGCHHKAVIAFIVGATHDCFIYRFQRTNDLENFLFVSVRTEPDTYVSCGIVRKNALEQWVFEYDDLSHFSSGDTQILALNWFIPRLISGEDLVFEDLAILYTGVCADCGEKLTSPASLRSGLCRTCWNEAKNRL